MSAERPTRGTELDGVVADALERFGAVEFGVSPVDDVRVYSFPQTHSDTTLGFGGFGGQMMASAQTYVVDIEGHLLVYFGGRFAYRAESSMDRQAVMDGVRRFHVPTRVDRRRAAASGGGGTDGG